MPMNFRREKNDIQAAKFRRERAALDQIWQRFIARGFL